MSPFFTRTGDDGYTGLLGEGRLPKEHARIDAIGTVDEAMASLGVARSVCTVGETPILLRRIQHDLYDLMAETAASLENANHFRKIDATQVTWLEEMTESTQRLVKIPSDFILPGDSPAGAAIDLARTIVRRAERRVSELYHTAQLENIHLLHYLNRLSSLLFVLELFENSRSGKPASTLAKEI